VFAGVRGGTDLAEHYASADVFAFPSVTETFGNVTTEALASGLAVCAFDYAAAREHVRHEESGLLAPRGDRGAFIANACRLVTDTRLRARLRAAATLAGAAITWDRVLDELEGVLREVIGRASSSPAAASPLRPSSARNDHAPS
jgi:glycosyltransferase involved in cell wall biosynthesis